MTIQEQIDEILKFNKDRFLYGTVSWHEHLKVLTFVKELVDRVVNLESYHR